MTDTVTTRTQEEALLDDVEQLLTNRESARALEVLEKAKADSFTGELLVRYYNAYGDAYFNEEKYNEALVKYKRCADKAEEQHDMAAKARAWEQIGIILHRMNRLRDAMRYAQDSLTAYRAAKSIDGQGRAYRNIGNLYVDLGYAKQALENFDKSREHFREANLPDEMAPAIIHKASVLYSQKNIGSSLEVYREGIEKDNCHHYLVLNNYGFLLMMDAKYEQALAMLEEAWKDINAKKVEDDDLALVKLNIGMAYVLQDDFAKGESFLREAVTLLEKYPDTRAVELLLQANDKYREQGFNKCLVVDNAQKLALTHLNLATLLVWNGRLDEAVKEAEMGIELDRDASYPYLAAGWIYLAKGDEHKASLTFQRAYSKEPSNEEFKKAVALINPYVLQKVGRNDPCPCGSGKKFKKCHGANV